MASLDMSLDDRIKSSRRGSERGGRGRGRARGGRGAGGQFNGRGGSFSGGRTVGAPRRGPLGVNARPSAYTIAKASSKLWMTCDIMGAHFSSEKSTVISQCIYSFRRTKGLPWQRDLLEESLRAAGIPGFENGTRLYVSNLDIGVTNEDIRELFSEIGELKRFAVHYDKNGRPSGSAEVLFARRSDAFQALKRYNNVQLDGKPMKIEIVGANSDVPVSARVNVVGGVNGRRTVVMTQGVGRGRGAFAVNRVFGQVSRGGMRGGRGRGRGRGGGRGRGRGRGRGGKPEKLDKDKLDKDLDSYHAMQT
ncbi:hypothetical protein RJ639_028713 [Escallonia herrerae]|uniref:RRM domain-containing protein n=1 Tax=Escallonia herrerae TaxID=1293975 RepID=A0AA89BFV1_9ASTE|nr:hypothetical protein RJ639_028713 [Escallonia herrerae]